MGIIKAIVSSVSSTLGDQWKEAISHEPFATDELMKPGSLKIGKNSANKNGTPDVISNGSIILVGESECAIALENGKVIGVYDKAGMNKFSTEKAASLLAGDSVKDVADTAWERVGFGGIVPLVHKVYYISTREIMNQPFNSLGTIPFRIVNDDISLDIDLRISIVGMYSFKITDPLKFYKYVAGNRDGSMYVHDLNSQMKSELTREIMDSVVGLKVEGIRPYELPKHVDEIAESMSDALTKSWNEKRGISVVSLAISGLSLTSEDFAIVKKLEEAAVLTDKKMAEATILSAQADAMKMASLSGNALNAYIAMKMAKEAAVTGNSSEGK